MAGAFKPNSECNLSTGVCDPVVGRAAILTQAIGPFQVGEMLCLHLVRSDPDGCVGFGFECLDEAMQPAPHLHHTIAVVGVATGIADPVPGGCGHGRVVENVSGCLPEDPIVPNCQ